MTFFVPQDGQEWVRQVERRLSFQERRTCSLVGTFVPVHSDDDQDALVDWYQPTVQKPLLIDRVDTTASPDLRYTKDGVVWFSIDTTPI